MQYKSLTTTRIDIGLSQVCAFCGKQLGTGFLNNTFTVNSYNCDCEKALKELELKKELNEKIKEYQDFINKNAYSKEVVEQMKKFVEENPGMVNLKTEIIAV